MTPTPSGYSYSVERDVRGPNDVDIALVRRESRRGTLGFGTRHSDPVVLFHRAFRTMFELNRLESYAAELERVGQHVCDGTFGCFIDTVSRDGVVQITLYERWFDGERLHCEGLAARDFDSDDEGALVASAEFVAALQSWAEERNDELEQIYRESDLEDAARIERATDRAAAADELAKILAEAGRSP